MITPRDPGLPAGSHDEPAPATDTSLLTLVLDRLGPHPFVDHLGVTVLSAGEGTARLGLAWKPQHSRSGLAPGADPSLHGGAAAALADMAASCALLPVLDDGDGRTTIDLSIHYLAPPRGDVVADVRLRRRGRRTAIIDVEMMDKETAVYRSRQAP